jgi:hypothetical protein
MLLDIFPFGNLLPVLSCDGSRILVELRLELVLLTLSLDLFVLLLDLADALKAIKIENVESLLHFRDILGLDLEAKWLRTGLEFML